MNTSPISHRMFVAALAHDGHAPDKVQLNGHDGQSQNDARTGSSKPSSETLAAWAARPWVNWPLVRAWEGRSAS